MTNTSSARDKKNGSSASSAPVSHVPLAEHPLVGAGLHFKDAHRRVENQAVVVSVFPSNNQQVGDLALIQYLGWMIGEPTTRRLVPLSDLASERWVIYSSVEHMNEHYQNVDERRNAQITAKLDVETIARPGRLTTATTPHDLPSD